MPYKPTGKPNGRPRKNRVPDGATQEPQMTIAAPSEPTTEAPKAAIPITETPEFKAALAEQRASIMTDVVAALGRSNVGGAVIDQTSLISDLTMAIAGMTDTGSNRKVIPPAERDRRVKSHERMIEVLERIHADPKLKPLYALIAPVHLDEQYVEKYAQRGDRKWDQTTIVWRGVPNSAMRPLNDIAKEIYTPYLESIGGSTSNTAGLREQPTWVTYGGLQLHGNPSQTASSHGLVSEQAEPMELGKDLGNTTLELTSVDDPNATQIPILGKTFAPATRTAPGDVAKLAFPPN